MGMIQSAFTCQMRRELLSLKTNILPETTAVFEQNQKLMSVTSVPATALLFQEVGVTRYCQREWRRRVVGNL